MDTAFDNISMLERETKARRSEMRTKVIEGVSVLDHPAFLDGAIEDKYDFTGHLVTTEHTSPDTGSKYPEWWYVFGDRVFNVSAPYRREGESPVRGIRWEESDAEGFFAARKADDDFEEAFDKWLNDDELVDVNEAFPCSEEDAERIKIWGTKVDSNKYRYLSTGKN
jgi:hypothetical protein